MILRCLLGLALLLGCGCSGDDRPWPGGVSAATKMRTDASSSVAYAQVLVASRTGNYERIVGVLDANPGLDLNRMRGAGDDTPLNAAASHGYRQVVDLLLSRGADPNAVGALGELPLVTAATTGHADVVALLLAHGARVNAEAGRWRAIAIERAARYGHADVVKLLIKAGADVNKVSMGGISPLVTAEENGHPDVAALLVAAGARRVCGPPSRCP